MSSSCIFCKIIAKEIPATIIHEDATSLGFVDIAPKALTHYVFVPKEHYSGALELNAAREAPAGHLLRVASEMAKSKGLEESGFRLVINSGPDAGQTVFHLHLHLLGGEALGPMA